MKFFFHPANENSFKEQAINNFVHTIVFDTSNGEVVILFTRQVRKKWEQTCKNNIETDHRIKELQGDNYQVYSWVSKSKKDLSLPGFSVAK
jgi:hypothetical protein